MTQRIQAGGLRVAKELYDFVTEEAIPGTGIEAEDFWRGLEQILGDLSAENKVLLEERDRMQAAIDAWHQTHAGQPADPAAYRRFLEEIGYLLPEGQDFTVATTDVDPEISKVAGPQLVVPITNARYALNAANARWGSLYDALYGSNVIPESEGAEIGADYNPSRGARVIERVMAFLDRTVPLSEGSHDDLARYRPAGQRLELVLADGRSTRLIREEDFAGYQGPEEAPTAILLRHHGLHIELQIDPRHPIGKYHPGGIKDVILEAAITTIQDCEDSVATVDADDKTVAYRNWLGLMKGNLSASFQKAGKTMHRHLAPDRKYTAPDGTTLCLPGRSLLFLRNVGHLMTSDAVIDRNGEEIPEGILDGMVSCLIGIHDLKGERELRNSRTGSLYIVKPKMHGPREVAFADKLFERIEDALGLQRYTIKMGIMDEERRTSVNLKECIRAARNRIVFINTGFLDRTGDEIHTSMEAGPMVRKTEMKHQRWIQAYEDRNVDVGLSCGLAGRAQIGKGMWPMPDEMRQMMETKGAHPRAGANTAWVPSPTAAVLHAMHYHEVDVAARQALLAKRRRARLEDMLTLPLLDETPLSEEEIEQELSNNIQGILGYVVRWVEQGVGCSTVPDINDIGLMEDRATLRISSQHIANWLRHGICSEDQVREIMRRMAAMVDEQNAGDPNYRNMAPRFEQSAAFQAASDLIFLGSRQPNGYTEPLLHSHRRAVKAPAR